MKRIIPALLFAVFFIAACNRGSRSRAKSDSLIAAKPNVIPADSATKTNNSQAAATDKQPAVNQSFKTLIADYLKLKNALTLDDSNAAAVSGKALVLDFDHFDQNGLTATQRKAYTDIADDAREMAEHIGKSADRLPHQREHFDMLSKDLYDLAKLLGAGRTLYVDHCPMYNDGKGANWLSETKEVRNPYLGKRMPDCGSLKEELR